MGILNFFVTSTIEDEILGTLRRLWREYEPAAELYVKRAVSPKASLE